MRIDYCPKCNKAGLRLMPWDEPKCWPPLIDDCKTAVVPNGYNSNRWCPRCKEWVKPTNRPYVSLRGVR